MRSYTLLWSKSTWNSWSSGDSSGRSQYIDYVAGDNKRPLSYINEGDEIFVVNVRGGTLWLAGRLIANSGPVSREKAALGLGRDDLLNKSLFVLAKEEYLDSFRSNTAVPNAISHSLELRTVDGSTKSPKLDNGLIYKQEFRSPYLLSDESAEILRALLRLPTPGDTLQTDMKSVIKEIVGDLDTPSASLISLQKRAESLVSAVSPLTEASVETHVNSSVPLEIVTIEASNQIESEYANKPGADVDSIVKTRLGQGSFRDLLAISFGGLCCLSKINNRRLLIASHIVPWSKSSPEQKTDPDNGLLLSVTWDALFDKGFISFDTEGRMICADTLDNETILKLGVTRDQVLPSKFLTTKRMQNLEWHRKRFGFQT